MKAALNVVRLICFAALLFLDDAALLAAYRRRFTVQIDMFNREARTLRRAAYYTAAVLHGSYRRWLYLMYSELEYVRVSR